MAKARPYHIKMVQRVEGKRAALAAAEDLKAQGFNPKVIPGIDPKCKANHYQPGWGGKIDNYCPQCKGYLSA